MKNSILVLLLLCPTLLWADPWDNLTLQQAEQVEAFLKTNPYIFDYCDCCDAEGEYATKVYLMKVTSTEIVTCDWNPEYYSVQADVVVLAEIPYTPAGPQMNAPRISRSEDGLKITMNYTWGYNAGQRKAAPLYSIVPYDVYGEQDPNSGYCRAFTTFPDPRLIKDQEYTNWYKSKF